jgi:hypothetical protein
MGMLLSPQHVQQWVAESRVSAEVRILAGWLNRFDRVICYRMQVMFYTAVHTAGGDGDRYLYDDDGLQRTYVSKEAAAI